ncbi:LysR family transcriptional regulator [Embleya sp. NBC_00896]|uniref:LysR family transcriptional regulator n=1 Tax=Embleya sp. NBC_00896 TaxID=2975961 RepID=UPI003869C07A|nr:LysR family transcriptional regulator [Embleya sp. NBC_00896]
MLETLVVEVLLTLVEELRFRRTAERLHGTTRRISQTIRNLERRVGGPVLEGNSRKVTLDKQLPDDLRPANDRGLPGDTARDG